MEEFNGDRLRQARLGRGLTLHALARKSGVRERSLIRWEQGHNKPRRKAVRALARALQLPMAELLEPAPGNDQAAAARVGAGEGH